MSETGRGTLLEVWDGKGDTRGGPGQVGGPSGRSGMGRGTHGEVRDWLEDPREVWDGSGDPLECLGWVCGLSLRSGKGQ